MPSNPHDQDFPKPSPVIASALIEAAVRGGKVTITSFVDQLWRMIHSIEFLGRHAIDPDTAAAAAAELDEALFDEVGGFQNYLHEFIETNRPAPVPPRIPRTPIHWEPPAA